MRNIISLDQQSEILYSLLFMYVQIEGYPNILKQGADHLLLPHIELRYFKKIDFWN